MPPKEPSLGQGTFTPYVPASKNIPEITILSVLLGAVLAVVLGAANLYLGLYAGMTVTASIPAAVISMAVLRGLLRRGTILENNIVQTMASTSESLAAGIIFSIPALLLTNVWSEFEYWPATLICIAGGLIGVMFMIPLRKPLICEDKNLTYPEGRACAEVLKAGEKGGASATYLFISAFIGALTKFLTSGTSFFKGTVEWAWAAGKGGFYFGTDISAALLGIGYIIGFNLSLVAFLGGFLGWIIGLPILAFTTGLEGNPMDWFWGAWSTKIRYIGVGSMLVGGIWSIISTRKAIFAGITGALDHYKLGEKSSEATPRTERNIHPSHILMLLIGTTLFVFGLYNYLIGNMAISSVATIAMIVFSFFFVAVCSYIAGLVGMSTTPLSGMIICAVLGTGGLLLLMGMSGSQGILATLGVASVVACSACCAGDISQDLKTGHIIGATPKKQQWMEVVAVLIPTLTLIPVLNVLNEAFGIGTGEPGALKAPQAALVANLVSAIFGKGSIPWDFVEIGIVVGIVTIMVDQFLKKKNIPFKVPVMAVAVGIYLPLTLTVPMLVGGLVAAALRSKQGETDNGTLFASGLVAGEAIIGVLLGFIVYFNREALPLGSAFPGTEWLTVLFFLGLVAILYKVGKKSVE